MDRVKKLYIVTLVLILGGGSIAVADDLLLPPWQRGADNSLYAAWEFDTDLRLISTDSRFGDVLLSVDSPHDWMAEDDQVQRTGIWPLSGEIDIVIPNALGGDVKHIWLQLTWKSAEGIVGIAPKPAVPFHPNIGVTTDPFYESMMISRVRPDEVLAGGWTHSTFAIDIWPNPSKEWLSIKGNILVDELVIDTICIPEPATVALLGVGALLSLRWRKLR